MLNNDLCKSCAACEAVCPVEAIHMQGDDKGFYYYSVDAEKCVNCNLCSSACDIAESQVFNSNIVTYATKSHDEKVRQESRSGGVFYEVAKAIIQNNGVVYGSALNGTKVNHIRIDCVEDISLVVGSKYVWSNHMMCFREIERDLKNEKLVFYTGLPCQVAALKAFIQCRNINDEKLILCDIICHGAPSPKLFNDYIQFQENKYRKKVLNVDFRNKKDFGWKAHIETLYFDGRIVHSDIWTRCFYSHYSLNSSCFECSYKRINRVGDFSLGDCWNIEKTNSVLNDDRGTSLLMINTKKGVQIIKTIEDRLHTEKIDINQYLQPALVHSVDKPKDYDIFWQEYHRKGFLYVLNKYIGYGIKNRLKTFIKICYYRLNKKRINNR